MVIDLFYLLWGEPWAESMYYCWKRLGGQWYWVVFLQRWFYNLYNFPVSVWNRKAWLLLE